MSWVVSLIVAGLMVASAGDANLHAPQPIIEPSCEIDVSTKPAPTPDEPQTGTQQERFDQTYPLNQNGRINLDNLNGEVVITAWDKAEVRVEAVKTIECDRPLQIDMKIDASPSLISISSQYGENTWTYNGKNSHSWGYGNRCRKASIDYKLSVPRTARLDQIETVNGAVILDGLTDYVKASTVNGKVTARNLRGSVNVSSVNGTLDVDFVSLENVRDVKIGMVNGTINLQLPSDVEATLKADTVNGSINNDFGLPVRRGEYVGRNLYGKLGDGGITMKLDGVNGTINIRRKQDGRTIKPVTNLLRSNDEDGFDENSNGALGNPPRAPRAPRPLRPGTPAPIPVPMPQIEIDDLSELDEKTRREVEEAIKNSLKNTDKSVREALKKAQENEGKVREALEQARLTQIEREYARLERMMNSNYNRMYFSPTERESQTVQVEGKPTVKINARCGTVSIRGWERSEVSYSIVKRTVSGDARKVGVNVEKRGSDVILNVIGSEERSSFRLEVFVPRQANIRLNANRAVRIEGITGELNMEGGEQSIDVRDAGGKMFIAATGGNVRVIGFEGEATVQTVTGSISLEGNFSQLATKTETGETYLTLPENAAALVETPFDRVTFDKNINILQENNVPAGKTWVIGNPKTRDKDAKFKLDSQAGQIYIRSLGSVRVTRNFVIAPDAEIFSLERT